MRDVKRDVERDLERCREKFRESFRAVVLLEIRFQADLPLSQLIACNFLRTGLLPVRNNCELRFCFFLIALSIANRRSGFLALPNFRSNFR